MSRIHVINGWLMAGIPAAQFVGGRVVPVPASTSTFTSVPLTGLTGGLAASPSADDFVIVAYSGTSSNTNVDMRTSSTGWTEQSDQYNSPGSFSSNFGVFTKKMGVSPDSSILVGPTGHSSRSGQAIVGVYRGVNTSTPLDVPIVIGGDATGRPNPGPITPITPGTLIVIVAHATQVTGSDWTTMGDLTIDAYNFAGVGGVGTIGIGSRPWTGGAYDCPVFTGGSASGNDAYSYCILPLRPA